MAKHIEQPPLEEPSSSLFLTKIGRKRSKMTKNDPQLTLTRGLVGGSVGLAGRLCGWVEVTSVHFEGVPSTVEEVVSVPFCCLRSWKDQHGKHGPHSAWRTQISIWTSQHSSRVPKGGGFDQGCFQRFHLVIFVVSVVLVVSSKHWEKICCIWKQGRLFLKMSSCGSRGFRGSRGFQCIKGTPPPFLNNPLPALRAQHDCSRRMGFAIDWANKRVLTHTGGMRGSVTAWSPLALRTRLRATEGFFRPFTP